MGQPVQVYLDSLSRYAAAMDELSASFDTTRRLLVEADVTEDSFGLLPDSRDCAEVYEQRTTDGLETLRNGADAFADLSDAFRELREDYERTDQAAAGRLGAGR
ncbi:hypothetical protein [Paractinoplanes hotanensis]|uniref:Excreted virulence factor EspC (Type VII ESX diderm) n=1 Tax=Paractinoplanes hotanensis TaxID=2906497 RepID=A0ABT0XQJ9_9ACTN|nr:hypothetical protein [Actinoplanes hotanensis]MCM4076048.1 hypothetical protein [Actinoplanes hotanensis]